MGQSERTSTLWWVGQVSVARIERRRKPLRVYFAARNERGQGGYRNRDWRGPYGERGARAYNGGLGAVPPAPWSGGQGAKPP